MSKELEELSKKILLDVETFTIYKPTKEMMKILQKNIKNYIFKTQAREEKMRAFLSDLQYGEDNGYIFSMIIDKYETLKKELGVENE